MEETRPISEIHVRTRHRKDMGDISALANSIRSVGLLHALVVNGDGELVAGERRLLALKSMGCTTAPVRIINDVDDLVRALLAERDENTCRKDFALSEAVALAETLEPMEKKAAANRQAATQGNKQSGTAKFAEPEKGECRQKVAKAVGVSHATLDKAKAVVEAAKAEPAKYQSLVEAMDKSGKVDGVFKQLKASQQPAEAATPAGREAGDDALEDETTEQTMERVNGEIESFCRHVMAVVNEHLPADPWLSDMGRRDGALRKFQDACSQLRSCKCQHVCPLCKGAGCERCHRTGRVPKLNYDQMV